MIELDGPPKSHFKYNGVIIHYLTYSLSSADEGELLQRAGNHIKKLSKQGIIVWRTRPALIYYNENDWPTIYYRLAVLPFSKTDDIPVKIEGQPAEILT